ncbi:hypothetical protein PMG11_09169 [Penicillium brasilianum]|uniref:Major facilitator superfamily (MFS) profile domain-containing protein n=1 Tax=Penicillium brasilianum TaxID=104259 RepID=A0A0F7TYV4_PENBI|nr:hypothetical protein PMG11_09169 [Penicillium brasilianum]
MEKLTTQTLGTVQLRHEETNEIILIPEPSRDPNDPLNWSTVRKCYLLGLVSFGIFLVNFVAVGPSVALASIAVTFFGNGPNLGKEISGKASYFQTATSLMVGMGNLFWVPLATKYGKRPVYIASFLLLTGSSVWCGVATRFASELAARVVLGTACGAPEIIAPLTLTDMFFLHQRGTVMVIYTCALSCGVGAGVVVSGLITMHHSWRVIYWLCTGLLGATTILVFFTFPETSYKREVTTDGIETIEESPKIRVGHTEDIVMPVPSKRTFAQNLRVFTTKYTDESFFVLAMRPIIALALPAVFWATLISSVTIGMIVIISANFSTAFANIYGFKTWQSGLTFISTIIGSLLAIFVGGYLTDFIADKLTLRNNGKRTPEMRLPALAVSLITAPLACILYGVGCGKQLHWICAVIGIGLVNFTTVQATNIAIVYIVDSYRPIAGEVIVTQSVFKGWSF